MQARTERLMGHNGFFVGLVGSSADQWGLWATCGRSRISIGAEAGITETRASRGTHWYVATKCPVRYARSRERVAIFCNRPERLFPAWRGTVGRYNGRPGILAR